jgi:maleylpyruvate isomerase
MSVDTPVSPVHLRAARRFKLVMQRWPRLSAIDAACGRLEAFRKAAPAAQPSAG